MATFEAEYISLKGNKIFLRDTKARNDILLLNDKVADIEKEIKDINNGIVTESSVQNPNVSYSAINQFLITESEVTKNA